MAKDSSGVGRMASNSRTWMPLAAMTQAASLANSAEWFRQSKQIATPFAQAAAPSALTTSANAWVV